MWQVAANLPHAEIKTFATFAKAVEYAQELAYEVMEVVISHDAETFVLRKLWD